MMWVMALFVAFICIFIVRNSMVLGPGTVSEDSLQSSEILFRLNAEDGAAQAGS